MVLTYLLGFSLLISKKLKKFPLAWAILLIIFSYITSMTQLETSKYSFHLIYMISIFSNFLLFIIGFEINLKQIERQKAFIVKGTLFTLMLAALAGTYLLFEAHFLAAIQIIVYAGAIMVLFLFVIMLVRARNLSPDRAFLSAQAPFAVAAGVLLGALVAIAILVSPDSECRLPGIIARGLVEILLHNPPEDRGGDLLRLELPRADPDARPGRRGGTGRTGRT